MLRRRIGPGAVARRSGYRVSIWIIASVAVLSASPYGLDILHERSLFFVTPLVLTCFAYWLAGGLRRPLWPTLAIAARRSDRSPPPDAPVHERRIRRLPTNVLWVGLSERLTDVPVRWFVVEAAIVGTVVFLRARTAALPLLCFVATIVFVNANFVPCDRSHARTSRRSGWVDEALPDGVHATVVHVAVDSTRCPNGPTTTRAKP